MLLVHRNDQLPLSSTHARTHARGRARKVEETGFWVHLYSSLGAHMGIRVCVQALGPCAHTKGTSSASAHVRARTHTFAHACTCAHSENSWAERPRGRLWNQLIVAAIGISAGAHTRMLLSRLPFRACFRNPNCTPSEPLNMQRSGLHTKPTNTHLAVKS